MIVALRAMTGPDPASAFHRLLRLRAAATGWNDPLDVDFAVRAVDRAFGQVLVKGGSVRQIKEPVAMLEGVRDDRAVEVMTRVLRRKGTPLTVKPGEQKKLRAPLQLAIGDLRRVLASARVTNALYGDKGGPRVAAVEALAEIIGCSAATIYRRLKAYRQRTESNW